MEIAPEVAQVFVSGVTVIMLGMTLIVFTALFSLLVGAIADWIMGVV